MSAVRKGYRECGRCGRNRALRFFKPNGTKCERCLRTRVNSASRETRLWETYGITLAEWDELWLAQNERCAICKRVPRYNCDVDHDHALERVLIAQGMSAPLAARASVRGLCCKVCNRRLLPAVKDNPDTLLEAVRYLNNPPAFAVLTRAERQ